LISRIILSELAQGTFSFTTFYARRARRLFPSLATVAAATWAAGYYLLLPTDFASLGRHLLAGAGFASNFLTFSEVGYFDAPAATKPLLHLWSLGVEEQFYIIFPAVVFLAARFRTGIAIAIVGFFAASFLLNVGTIHQHASFAFYLPLTRLWEFLIGSVLAYGEIHGMKWRLLSMSEQRPTLRELGAGAGLLMLVASIVFVRQATFPGWWAILPALGAALLIGTGPDTWVGKALSNRVFVFIGLISYPLYLWHWSLIVMGKMFMRGEHPNTVTLVAIPLAFVLAWLSYRYIERPIRASRPKAQRRWLTIGCASCLAVVALLGAVTARDGLVVRYPEQIRNIVHLNQTHGEDYPLIPGLGAATNDKGPLVVVWGDSHAQHLLPGLRKLQDERTFRLLQLVWWDQCPPVGMIPDWDRCPYPGPVAMAQLKTLSPDVVILAANWLHYGNRVEKINATLSFLREIGVRKIVLMGPVPWFPRPPRITLYEAYLADPLRPLPDRLSGFDEPHFAVESELKEIAARFGVIYISPRSILCNDQGCLARLGNSAKDIVQVDGNHFAAGGSEYFVRHIAPLLFGE
jgi:peptidoglycan/LPS O-acetylase OafA/YrhL